MKKSIDVTKKALHQMPSSHCPWKYLSPNSKTKRSRNARQQRARPQKQVLKFYKKSKVELPANQSTECCQLIEAIERSEEVKKELDKIKKDGNKLEGKSGLKAGTVSVKFGFKDQQNNGKDHSCFGYF